MTILQNSKQNYKQSWADHTRLVWTLASKDIVDALKTKATLTTILISLVMVVFYRYFPVITADNDTLRVFTYAESDSGLVEALERSPSLAIYPVDSRERMFKVFAGTEAVELAIEIPESAVVQAQGDGPITIEGYMMYWVDEETRAEIKAQVEDDLSTELGRPVTLHIEGNDVNFNADQFFFAFSSTFALLFIGVMIGISLIPNLMVEEKKSKTLDALFVSPVSEAHLVAGKALAGLFYGLLGSAIVMFVFRYLIIQWEFAILAAILGTLFMVGIGLLLGSFVNVQAQLQLVASFIIIPLLVPVFLVALEGLIPTGIIAVLNWIPTVLVAKLFRLSLTPNVTFAHYGLEVVVIIGCTLALLALVVWVVRRRDRK